MAQESPEATTAKNNKKRTAKKKRKISKHILQANKDHVELEKAQNTEETGIRDMDLENVSRVGKRTTNKEPKKKQQKKKQANSHTKDVKEAAGYLSNWKHHKDIWKFNKNTQSWLIRHMYEAEKVSKSTFTLLLEYLEGLQGGGAKARVIEEATRRALRYKKYSEEHGDQNEDGFGETDKKGDNKDNDKTVKFSEDTKEPAKEEKKKKLSKKEQLAANDEEARWNALDDHDKRREYKRARKILETLRELL